MTKSTKLFLLIGLGVIIILASILYILYRNNQNDSKNDQVIAEGIKIEKKDNVEYIPSILKDYSEYQSFLNTYGLSDLVYLTNKSFDDKEYIVDFIDYEDGLNITNINLSMNNDERMLTDITYYTNKKVTDSKYYLIYFIPVDKNTFNSVNITNREFLLNK